MSGQLSVEKKHKMYENVFYFYIATMLSIFLHHYNVFYFLLLASCWSTSTTTYQIISRSFESFSLLTRVQHKYTAYTTFNVRDFCYRWQTVSESRRNDRRIYNTQLHTYTLRRFGHQEIRGSNKRGINHHQLSHREAVAPKRTALRHVGKALLMWTLRK